MPMNYIVPKALCTIVLVANTLVIKLWTILCKVSFLLNTESWCNIMDMLPPGGQVTLMLIQLMDIHCKVLHLVDIEHYAIYS